MRALTYHGPFDVRVTDVPDPTLFDDEAAVVAVRACGICGSDLHIYEGHGFSADLGFCVGHEAVGEVVEVGSSVSRFRIGDSVLVAASVGCASCGPCRAGYVLGCERNRSGCYGLGAVLPGSQAQYVAVPCADGNLVAIPEGIGDDAAIVLTDNAPTAWYGARRARIVPGDVVAVVGLGPVGIMSVLAAQILGAGRVLAIDLVAERRSAAAALGAEPVDGDPKVVVRELTKGRGADVVLEAVGADATIDLAIKIAARGARVSIVGVTQSPQFPMHLQLAQFNELELAIGLCSVQRELPQLLALTAGGRLHPEVVVTHHLPLRDGADAYARFHVRVGGVGKIVLDPSR
ncbi:MAG: alcohol dehydrogenase catalytic domain-containing protein [Acidimicrobiia bacterium]